MKMYDHTHLIRETSGFIGMVSDNKDQTGCLNIWESVALFSTS